MKLLLGSDLHLEFRNQQSLPELPEYDIAILAGDIGTGHDGIHWAVNTFLSSKPLIYVPGNHEYYGREFNQVNLNLSKYAESLPNVHVLNPGTITIEGVKFIGATLWTDFRLEGYLDYASSAWKKSLSDFQIIRYKQGLFLPEDAKYLFQQQAQNIWKELHNSQNNKKVVVTHFMPSQETISPFWVDNNLNPYFCNDMDPLIIGYKPELWLYGHTHNKGDIIHSSGTTRMIANPRGYPKEKKDYFEWKVIEID